METFGFDDPTKRTQESADWNYHSGINGIPFRTKSKTVSHYKNSDPARSSPKMVQEVSTSVFDLSNSEQLAEMNKVLNMCARGSGRVMEKQVQYDESIKNWRVLLMWATFFYEDPNEAMREGQRHTFQ
jgi:exosome complex RNA-binding protein Csl4